MKELIVTGANIIVLFSIAWMVWKKQSELRNLYWPALLLKCLAGIALGLIYTHYYHISDSWAYFEDGTKLSNLARHDFRDYIRFFDAPGEHYWFWPRLNFRQPRALFLSDITSVFCLLTGDNYWLISSYYSLICFLTAWLLVKTLRRLDNALTIPATIAFLFFPSVMFWTAGLMKETLAMASVYLIIVFFLKVWMGQRLRWWYWLVLIIACWLLWNLKYYYMAALLPVLATALIFRLFIFPNVSIKKTFYAGLLWVTIFMVPLFVASIVHPNFYPERFLSVIVENYHDFAGKSSPGGMVHYSDLEPTVGAILINVPSAFFAALYRPLPWEADVIFKVFMSIENVALLVLTIAALFNIKNAARGRHRFLVFSVLVYVGILAVFLGLSSPNFGTLVRYRVGFLPFFVLLITADNPVLSRITAFLERRFSFLGRVRS
jgi:hypothetical protein